MRRSGSDLMKELVLITGGAGFIGSHTADILKKNGYQVRILDNLDPQVHGYSGKFPSYLDPEIECFLGDVRSQEDLIQCLDGVSYIFHFASLTGVGQSMYDLKSYSDVNITGSANLIETIIKKKINIKKLILSSSRAVYGEGTRKCPECDLIYPETRSRVDLEKGSFEIKCPKCGNATVSTLTIENRPLKPTSFYGWSKKAQEDIFKYASKTFNLDVVILRYFNVYGSRQSLINPYTGIVSIFYSRLMASQPISIFENNLPLRDFIHVQDVAQANINALRNFIPSGEVINIGTGTQSTISDIAAELGAALNKKPEFIFNGEFRVGDILACTADIAKARELIGFNPSITLKEGMQEFVNWARKQGFNDLYQEAISELRTHSLFGNSKDKGK
jgi:dTDP-L-rhamnose 4-epimerase